jgi:hypothetical protein
MAGELQTSPLSLIRWCVDGDDDDDDYGCC